MSIEISQRVWNASKQYGSNKLVLLVLADHANSDGYCYPGVDRIARWAQVEDRQARRIIHEIAEHGEIYISTGGGRNGTNQYLVTVGMDHASMVNALVRYFKLDRIEAEKIAATTLALRDLPNPKPSRRTKNPVLQDEDDTEDSVNSDNLSCETAPPVLQDQNPDMERVYPVIETPRTVINHQITAIEPSVHCELSKADIQREIKSYFHIHAEFAWQWLDTLVAEMPDISDHIEAVRRCFDLGRPNDPFDVNSYTRVIRAHVGRKAFRAAKAGAT